MPFSLGRFLDPIGIIPGVGKGKGSIKNGWDAFGAFTKDANDPGGSGAAAGSGGRNLNDELEALFKQLPGFAGAGYDLQSQYGGQFLQNALFGNQTFDAAKALAGKSPEERASIEAEATRTGRTPEQWLNDHTLEQMRAGNQAAQADFDQYGTNGGVIGGLGDTSGIIDQLNNASASSYRMGAFNDSGALDAKRRQLNPELYSLMDYADQMAKNPRGPSDLETLAGSMAKSSLDPTAGENMLYSLTGSDGLAGRLNQSAQDQLALGDRLSDSETAQLEQDTRRSFAARGLYDSNGAIGSELMNLDQARQSRLKDRQAFATNTAGLSGDLAGNLASIATNRQNSGIANLASAEGITQGRESLDFNKLLSSIGYRQGSQTDPLALLNGNAGSNQNNASSVLGMSSAFGGSMPDYMNMLLGYGSDVANTNFNATEAGKIAAGNNAAAKKSSTIAAGATVASAAIPILIAL